MSGTGFKGGFVAVDPDVKVVYDKDASSLYESNMIELEIASKNYDRLHFDDVAKKRVAASCWRDPFKFVSKLMEMDLGVLNDIYPETGSIENILKYYTFDEAVDRYIKWKFTSDSTSN